MYDEKKLLSDNSKVRNLTGWVPDPNITNTVKDILQYWRKKVDILFPRDVVYSLDENKHYLKNDSRLGINFHHARLRYQLCGVC